MKLQNLEAAISLKNCKNALEFCKRCSELFDMPVPSQTRINWIMNKKQIVEVGVWVECSFDSFCFYLKYDGLPEQLNKPLSFYLKFVEAARTGKSYISLWTSKPVSKAVNRVLWSDSGFYRVDRTNWDYDSKSN